VCWWQIGKVALELASTSLERREQAVELLEMAQRTLDSASSWRVRQACVNFVREMSHSMILDEIKLQTFACLDKAMGDSMLEVRTTACFSLAGLLRSMPMDRITDFLARAPKPRRRGAKTKDQSEEDRAAQLVRRHAKATPPTPCCLNVRPAVVFVCVPRRQSQGESCRCCCVPGTWRGGRWHYVLTTQVVLAGACGCSGGSQLADRGARVDARRCVLAVRAAG
jgi:hypothetical protein